MELLKSEVLVDNDTFRFDSEFFKKEYLNNIKILKNNGFYLKTCVDSLTGGATPLGANYQDSGIPFLRVQNIMPNYFNLNDIVYLNAKQDEEIKRSKLKYKDVLLTITGSYGKSATVTKELINSNINQHSVKITLKENSINPYFLSTFFNSKYGKLQSDKNITGVTRPALDYSVIRNFIIPKIDAVFQNKIEELINLSEQKTNQSKTLYQEAEALLLEEVGLTDFQSSQEAVNIKSFSESFGKTERLDAEYYQPKYEDYIGKIISQNHQRLCNIVTIKKSIEPGSKNYDDEGLPFIRVSDFSKNGITLPNKKLKDDFVRKNKKQLDQIKPKKGTILFSKDGTVGIACHLRKDYEGITSGAILHLGLKTNEVLPEYLTLALNSDLVQKQAERDAGGSIIQHWREEEIKSVVIPIIAKPIQEKIAEKIERSFALKKESERLLEIAKQAVETAIEEGEEAALAFLGSA